LYDEDLSNLDEWIRRLRVEYDIFFNGHRKKPPEDLKARVEKLVKKLAEVNMSFAQRFRYTTLVGRFYVYRDHWRRQLMEREQGIEAKASPPAGKAAAATPEPGQARSGVQITIGDPAAEQEKIQQLFDWLVQIKEKEARNAPPVSYEQFSRYIATQTQGIKKKLGCANVIFRISVEADAIKFTAKGGD